MGSRPGALAALIALASSRTRALTKATLLVARMDGPQRDLALDRLAFAADRDFNRSPPTRTGIVLTWAAAAATTIVAMEVL
jgi:hypothetical protein